MHPAEPIEPNFVSTSRHADADESWRAEVASRVSSYRTRRKPKGGPAEAPALDFGSPAEAHGLGSQSLASQDHQAPSSVVQGAKPRSSVLPARKAVDTNYYRRLNAELMAHNPGVTMGATVAAIVPAHEFEEELDSEAERTEELFDTPEMLSEKVRAENVGGDLRDKPCDDPALDLEICPANGEDSFLERYCISEPELGSPVASTPVPVAQGKLIAFRRPFMEPPLVPQPARDELAEPMNNRPRILEVPEDIIPAFQGSLFPEIRLDADEQEASNRREPEIKMPLPVAPVSERLMASLTDFAVVIAASLLFAGIAWRQLPGIPHTKPFWMGLGAVTLLLWILYQHLFLLYAGRTLGMSMRGIRLSTFDGRVPEWKERASRARCIFISFASVTLGFIWALVDPDTLCWHDHISRTFPTTE